MKTLKIKPSLTRTGTTQCCCFEVLCMWCVFPSAQKAAPRLPFPLLWCGTKGRKTLNYPYAFPQEFWAGVAAAALGVVTGGQRPGSARSSACARAAAGPERGLGPGSAAVAPWGAGPLRAGGGRAGSGAAGPGPRSEPGPARGQRGGAGGAAGAPPPPVLRAARVPPALPARPRLAALARRGGGCGATAAAASRQARSCPSIGAAISAGTR